jgi:hypothetical protein
MSDYMRVGPQDKSPLRSALHTVSNGDCVSCQTCGIDEECGYLESLLGSVRNPTFLADVISGRIERVLNPLNMWSGDAVPVDIRVVFRRGGTPLTLAYFGTAGLDLVEGSGRYSLWRIEVEGGGAELGLNVIWSCVVRKQEA